MNDCKFCKNATTDSELTSSNDLSYFSIPIGHIRSGDNRGVAIVTTSSGIYVPKFCPECGRKLKENIEILRRLK